MNKRHASSFPAVRAAASVGAVAAFAAIIREAAASGRLPAMICWFYLAAGAAAFLTYAIDKSAAIDGRQRERRRVPESTLHLLSLAGGWPGALAAQGLLRHKSRKQPFQAVFWITVALHCGVLGWFLLRA